MKYALPRRYCLRIKIVQSTMLATMRRIQRLLQAAATTIVLSGLLGVVRLSTVQADAASVPSLVISQLKITSTNGQFVSLYNSSSTVLDMSKYQLEYFNSYDLSKATSSRLIALSGVLPPHSYYLVNDSSQLLCYQLTVDSVSLGFSSTAGLVEVLAFNQIGPGASVVPSLQDFVGWSKTVAPGAQTLPANTNAFLQRQPLDVSRNPAVASPGAGSWQSVQPDPSNACNLVAASGVANPVDTGLNQLLPSSEPPVTILNVPTLDADPTATVAARLPATDIGLMAPKITELLPNPDGTGNDATDEFIELYNPNARSFDLSGFTLRSGLTSYHTYVFPAGTQLPPQSFVAFYADVTSLSLSNTSGQVALLDPFGTVIEQTQPYVNAKDGQSWAPANGAWVFTTKLTPNAPNIINAPVTAKQKAAAKAKAGKAIAAKSAKTAKPKQPTKLTASSQTDTPSTPIHPWTLALVGAAALLYGAYEYRADMANRIYQFRSYRSARRANRGKA